MTKIKIEPADEGYSVAFPAQVRADPLEGGRSRLRRDKLGARARVGVQWFTDAAGYDYLQAFYRQAAGSGTQPFTIDLPIEHAGSEEHTVDFVPGTLQLGELRGPTFIVTAELQAQLLPADSIYDEAIIMGYEAFGDEMAAAFIDLAELVNVTMPEWL